VKRKLSEAIKVLNAQGKDIEHLLSQNRDLAHQVDYLEAMLQEWNNVEPEDDPEEEEIEETLAITRNSLEARESTDISEENVAGLAEPQRRIHEFTPLQSTKLNDNKFLFSMDSTLSETAVCDSHGGGGTLSAAQKAESQGRHCETATKPATLNVSTVPCFANTRYGDNAEPSTLWTQSEVNTAAPFGMLSKNISEEPAAEHRKSQNMSEAVSTRLTPCTTASNNPTVIERENTVLAPSVLQASQDLLNVQSGRLIRPPICDSIKIHPPPSADKYMEWRHTVFTRVAAASKRVRECWVWLHQIDKCTKIGQLFESGFSDVSGPWEGVDMELATAIQLRQEPLRRAKQLEIEFAKSNPGVPPPEWSHDNLHY
jgi:hypothetical protein